MKLYDQNGGECQMTGLEPWFYLIEAADQGFSALNARIAELEDALESAGRAIVQMQHRTLDATAIGREACKAILTTQGKEGGQ